jgi:hypothetical protein
VVTPEPRVGRSHEGVEVAPATVEPLKRSSEARAAERCLGKAHRPFDDVRNVERAEDGLERRAQSFDRGRHDRDVLRPHTRAQQPEDLVADELQHAAMPGAFEEAKGALDARWRLHSAVAIELPLEIRERGACVHVRCRR